MLHAARCLLAQPITGSCIDCILPCRLPPFHCCLHLPWPLPCPLPHPCRCARRGSRSLRCTSSACCGTRTR